MTRPRRPLRTVLAMVLVAGGLSALAGAEPAAATTLPSGFQEQIVFSGLSQPTNIEFAPDGRVFVAEKGGRIKVFDNLADPTPTVFADLSTNVFNVWDRGLLGLALAPGFPANPYVYVLYSYDAPPGQTAPFWNDNCGDANNGQCVVQGRLSRLQAAGDVMTGSEQVLITDWCQQFPSHSIGDLKFGADGMLYVSGGDGASFSATDYGQFGTPRNPCADPPSAVGGAMNPPTAEGGALRSQDVRSTGDPTTLDGAVLRLDPATGAAAAGNPLAASPDANARRIVAHGLRNPFRLTVRPGTNEVWAGDVGWNVWEEINRVTNPTGGVTNFGWPCYEGMGVMGSYDGANLNLCESLYSGGGHTQPYYTYNHSAAVVPGENCGNGGDATSGLAFYPASGGNYPAAYAGALFFADYSRNCIWAMKPTTPGGLPSTSAIEAFGQAAAGPVDLQIGPGNELYYVDLGGTVRRIRYFPGNQPPVAAFSATPVAGQPLRVTFDASASSDADPADQGRLTYAWDFTNDGSTDATGATAAFTYPAAGSYTAKLTVTDTLGATDTHLVALQPGHTAPVAVIDTPAAATTWKVGDTIAFSGHATDADQGDLPAGGLSWRLRMHHCESVGNCHVHEVQQWTGAAGGSFVAPDHEYPSYLELELTATDADGLSNTASRQLDPKTVDLTFRSNPAGLQLNVGAFTGATPFTRTVIQGSTNSVSAPTPQSSGGSVNTFASWSDGGANSHVITAPTAAATYTATFTGTPGCADSFGYVCTTQTGQPFAAADGAVLPLTGDDAVAPVSLPFPFRLYGQEYGNAWVSTNGFVSFADPAGAVPANGPLPSTGPPNAAVYPFWDDLVQRADSTVRTGVSGAAPNRKFTVEWRNSGYYGSNSGRVRFSAVFGEDGSITYHYADLSTAGREQGNSATVGIEDGSGTVGLAYSVEQPVLRDGTTVTFSPPGGTPPPTSGTISGVVSANGNPLGGATLTLSPGGRTATSAGNGSYQFTAVAPGAYTVAGTAPGGFTGSAPVTVTAGGAHTVNLTLTGPPPGSGDYTKTTQARPYVSTADGTVLPLTGDDAVAQISLPFGFEFYGQQQTTAWVSTNGVLSFVNPGGATPDNTAIPATGLPNAAIYPYWDDLVQRSGSAIRTKVVGSAPNRQFVIDWFNTGMYGSSSARISAQVVLAENGEIALNYADLATTARERGDSATVGIEDAAGLAAVQHSFNQGVLTNGEAIVFTPN
ncbi:PQQ-dependent sugar dehydrogenase [Asanoa sp. NPDC049573]|uniref:PQQ-dependent sugar dehydrogenase n=1 Tax=Asanoa sp. NPDC049573 TaxID=3155396 RepID=UPI0034407756